MITKSRRIELLRTQLDLVRGIADRWRTDWERTNDELMRVKLRLVWLDVAQVHTDGDGKRFVYLPKEWP